MIAIVVLGIGLVMVATIFPVAVMQTREAVELSLAPAIADQAIATLKSRLSTWNDFEAQAPPGTPGRGVIDTSGAVDQADAEDEISQGAREQSDWPNDPWNADPQPGYFPIPCENLTRLPVPNPGGDTLANYFTNGMAITENRNDVSLDTDQEIARLVSASLPGGTDAAPAFIRTKITAFERVYPLGDRTRADGTGLYGGTFSQDVEDRFMAKSAKARYAWKAFARRVSPASDHESTSRADPAWVGQRVFEVVVFVLKRSGPASRFVSQAYPVGPPPLDVQLRTPLIGPATRSTLFPQAWLVLFDSTVSPGVDDVTNTDPDANYATGQIRCFYDVSRLLPPGSVFIDFETGSPHKVLSRTLGTNYDILRLAPEPQSPAWDATANGGAGGLSAPGAQFAWVFPPAVDLSVTDPILGGPGFTSGSPVVEVFRAQIAVN